MHQIFENICSVCKIYLSDEWLRFASFLSETSRISGELPPTDNPKLACSRQITERFLNIN